MASVKAAIHVKPDINWEICSDIVNYNSDVSTVMPIYYRLLKKNLKVLIYSGDADSVVDYTYSESWTSNLGLTETSSFRQWYFVDDDYPLEGQQVGGLVTEYSEGLQFATVIGSGHMVPQWRPKPAFQMFKRFISGQPL